jgi:hypothetical protein
MTNSEQDVIIDLPSSHLEEDSGDELNAAQLGESSKNEQSSEGLVGPIPHFVGLLPTSAAFIKRL